MKLFRVADTKDGGLLPLDERSYRDADIRHELGQGEKLLKQLLFRSPELIPSDEIDSDDPPRFTTIMAEASVAAGSIDVLLLDHNGVPTVIEAKLVDNREIRRAVLAQGLEYLAHLSTDWTPQRFFERARKFRETNPSLHDQPLTSEDEARLLPLLAENLRENRLRLIIAADHVPTPLRRIIEFLGAASNFDVYGLEVQMMSERGGRELFLTAQLIGTSERARRKPASTQRLRWDEESFFSAMARDASGEEQVARDLMSFGRAITARDVIWGTGSSRGSFSARLRIGDDRFSLFSVFTNGDCTVNLGWSYQKLLTAAPGLTDEFRRRVEKLFGVSIHSDVWERPWGTQLTLMAVREHLDEFKDLVSDFAAAIRKVWSSEASELA